MKNKYRNELKIISYITSTERYKGFFLISIILSLYGSLVLGSRQDNFFDSLLVPLQFSMFNVFLFAIIFLNNMNACSIFKKEFPDYILRLKTKKEYVKTLIKLSAVMFLFQFIIILLLMLIPLILTTFNDLSSHLYQNYTINNIIYLLFYCIRYMVYGILLTMISTLIFANTNSKVVLVVNGTFLLLMFYFGQAVSFQSNFSLSIWSYFKMTIYSTFSLELASSVFMALILEIIVIGLYILSIKNRKLSIL